MRRRQFLQLTANAAALSAISRVAGAQGARTIKIVVPFPPGGVVDMLGRILGQQITASSGQSIVVENRPGAGTVIATEAVARAIPDGTTVLFVGNSFLINANLRSLSYDPLTNFEPVCLLVNSPQVLVVNSSSPFRSMRPVSSSD